MDLCKPKELMTTMSGKSLKPSIYACFTLEYAWILDAKFLACKIIHDVKYKVPHLICGKVLFHAGRGC